MDGSRTKAYSGTGLGLAISQKLMEAMGARFNPQIPTECATMR
ncbi:MAG: hypothetical protein KA717_09205 [Woronichinia naegeliana WA131]|uniref:Histidine kinase/HSP90-like ATPase domain-containing protein n=1 Tax=Woronichinia naegeliana WA131 TaxID=2824559 RepID=A0A977L326_9CYAN|nr:MAG: hypothetical protein KA717_09205 [Woronichinia naegeliana WA131]